MLLRILAVLLLAAAPAAAQPAPPAPPADSGADPDGEAPEVETRIELRVGGSSADDNGRPAICAEVGIAFGFSVEGCGTGSGILHDDDGGEMAHFRAKKSVYRRALGAGGLDLAAGLGFAELEVGPDDPGFDFGDPDGVEPSSIAGPEASLSAKYLAPIGRGFELVANASLGLAYFDGAPALVVPHDRLQPFASFEIGVGW